MSNRYLDRLDIAIERAGKSRNALAQALGMTRQNISKLARSPSATLKPSDTAHAAKFLKADLYWLSTGEGGDYVPERDGDPFSPLTMEMAQRIEELDVEARAYAYVILALVARGERPAFPSLPEPAGRKSRGGPPNGSRP